MSKFKVNSLAAVYRPRTFDDVIGQDSAVATLQGMLKLGSIPNAIMFTGGSGTGKTTLARIFAYALNCKTSNNCGKCESCKLVKHPDVSQQNAATARGIDEIRKLIDSANYRPRHNVRVIIMDEAHQLTPQAVEALLVPLEEPPAQTMYIMCTTDPQKFPDTLIKRCTIIPLNRPSKSAIANRLSTIAKDKKIKFSKDVLTAMAEASEGCVRDAINIMERGINLLAGNSKVKDDELIRTLGNTATATDVESAMRILLGMYNESAKAIVKAAFQVEDATKTINAAIFMNQYYIGCEVANNSRHVWHSPQNREFKKQVEAKAEKPYSMNKRLAVHRKLIELRNAMHNVPTTELSMFLAYLTGKSNE